MYPALQQLEDEGLIRAGTGDGGRRAYQLTDAGRTTSLRTRTSCAPLGRRRRRGAGGLTEMRTCCSRSAWRVQVVSAGTDGQVRQARKILTETRRSLYRILAADDDEETGGSDGAARPPAAADADPGHGYGHGPYRRGPANGTGKHPDERTRRNDSR